MLTSPRKISGDAHHGALFLAGGLPTNGDKFSRPKNTINIFIPTFNILV